MIAVDTNVLVRLIAADDPRQLALARNLFEQESVFIAKTVLLETEWVLRTGYRVAPEILAAAIRALLGLSNVTMEDRSAVGQALDWYDSGFDFADALHLASSARATGFATFDRKFERLARSVENAPAVALLA